MLAAAGCQGGAGRTRAPAGATTASAPVPSDAPSRVPVTVSGGRTAVPSLVGLDTETAALVAQRAGFEVVVLRVAGAPAGLVLSQDPVGGVQAPQGTPIGVRVATGSTASAPPPSDAPTPAVAPPPVIPEPVPRGTTSRFTPDGLPREVVVPSVVDRTPQEARRLLEAAGLEASEQPGHAGTAGTVVDQYPVAGERVPRGSVVVVRIPGLYAEAPAPIAPTPAPSAGGEGLGSPEDAAGAPPPAVAP